MPQPPFDALSESIIEIDPVQIKGKWVQQWKVVDLPIEQILANKKSKRKALADKIDTLWQAADKYTSSFISGVAIGILTIGVLQQKPKALAVSQWSSAIWAEYYRRKQLVTTTSQDDHDFTSFGHMPYSVTELQAEVGL